MVLTGDDALAMPEIDVRLRLSDIHPDIEVPPADAPEDEGG